MEATGDLYEIRGEIEFEWKIKDFFLLSDKTDYCSDSPEFDFSGSSWIIQMCPNGETEPASEGWIGLYLMPTFAEFPVTLDYSFSLKNNDGETDFLKKVTYVFIEKNYAWGFPRFIRRSVLIERKSELLPLDVLTVICTLKNRGENDTAGINKLGEDFKEILLNGNVSDVVLKVEDQEFKCHRSILAARSPVFLAMMMHDTKEKATGVVDIQGVDPNTFPDFLNYVYTGSVESVTSENAHKLYETSDMYQVNELKNICLEHMLNNISIVNICDVFTLSHRHDEKDLKEACIKFFAENSLDIVVTSNWQTFLCENPILGNELFIKHFEFNKFNRLHITE